LSLEKTSSGLISSPDSAGRSRWTRPPAASLEGNNGAYPYGRILTITAFRISPESPIHEFGPLAAPGPRPERRGMSREAGSSRILVLPNGRSSDGHHRLRQFLQWDRRGPCGYHRKPFAPWRAASALRAVRKWFNTAAFTANAPGTFGTLGRNTLVGPGTRTLIVDFRLSRCLSPSVTKWSSGREFFNTLKPRQPRQPDDELHVQPLPARLPARRIPGFCSSV